MAELKRDFLKAKMNKDFDERVVPNGEYRDALNVEITTSEGSDVGAVQTLAGNKYVENQLIKSPNAITVGSYADEENNHIYNFVERATDFTSQIVQGNPAFYGKRSDLIERITPASASNEAKSEVIINDVYEVRVVPMPMDSRSKFKLLIPSNYSHTYNINSEISGEDFLDPIGIRVGMRAQCIGVDGVDVWGLENDIRVISYAISYNSTFSQYEAEITITTLPQESPLFTSAFSSVGGVIKLSSKRVLDFSRGKSGEVEYNDKFKKVTPTPEGSIISAINVIDDYLLWTDGRTEPKKINLKRCISGNSLFSGVKNVYYLPHTHLVSEINNSFYNKGYLELSNITAIKPNPTKPLSIDLTIDGEDALNSSVALLSKAGGTDDPWEAFSFKRVSGAGETWIAKEGDKLYVSPKDNVQVTWRSGDTIVLNAPSPYTYSYTINIIERHDSSVTWFETIITKADTAYLSDYATSQPPSLEWIGTKASKDQSLYFDKFVKFSYRYNYADGEKSCIAPYTRPAFVPGIYSYDAKEGFNNGMINIISEIVIKDLRWLYIPNDVASIEILYTMSNNENVYAFKTIDVAEQNVSLNGLSGLVSVNIAPWQVRNTIAPSKDVITIDTEMFGYTLPTDQIVRTFDALPRKAVAQEIMGSRLMYGNYTRDYNLTDGNNDYINLQTLTYPEKNNFSFNSTYESDNRLVATANVKQTAVLTPRLFYSAGGVTVNHYVSEPLLFSDESGDGSDNFDNSTGIFTAPVSGTYYFSGSTNALIYTRVPNYPTNFIDSYTDGGGQGGNAGNIYVFQGDISLRRHRVKIHKCDASGVPLSLTDPGPQSVNGNGPGGFTISPGTSELIGVPNSFSSTGPNYLVDEAGQNLDIDWALYQAGVYSEANQSIIETTSMYLEANEKVAMMIHTDQPSEDSSGDVVNYNSATFRVSRTPHSTVTDARQGTESIKSNRKYHIGVVYIDDYGRESNVIISESNDMVVPLDFSDAKTNISVQIKSKAPSWATRYKVFVKEVAKKYQNLVLDAAFENNDGVTAWLSFNSADKDKIKKGDYIRIKKENGNSTAVKDKNARLKILDIEGDATIENANTVDAALSIGGNNVSAVAAATISSASDLAGKFFAKVRITPEFEDYITDFTTGIPEVGQSNGAVFETEPDTSIQTDIYYEASQAYPIYLTEKNISDVIKKGCRVTFESVNYSGLTPQGYLTVESFKGAKSISPSIINNDGKLQNKVRIYVSDFEQFFFSDIADSSSALNNGIEIEPGEKVLVKFKNEDGSYVTAYLSENITQSSNGVFYIDPTIHPTPAKPNNYCRVGIPWFNCYSFGNGVESDTIRDDFNSDELLTYFEETGRKSGEKANIPLDSYSEVNEANSIIYSGVYSKASAKNELNEFIAYKNITKELNHDYGSIQKLFSRDSDLVALCEAKAIKILSEKDALFNADGNLQLLSSTNVLGQAIPFSGDYGISKNPESFAKDEYRAYFVDKDRGAVLRLSKDGLTPISDAGMKDWFRDHLSNSSVIIGSFDSRKEEYNVTLHDVTMPRLKKNVYTLSFNETIDGWSSFKSFIQESGLTLKNKYYTFKAANAYQHHSESSSKNNFYQNQYNSTITTLFNENPDVVKNFTALSYEGTQAKVNSGKYGDGTYVLDEEYYNLEDKDGWSAEYVKTDLSEGYVNEFIEKENKWFNYIKGQETQFTNYFDGPGPRNIDMSEFSVQGLGQLTSDATMEVGVEPTQGYTVSVVSGNSTSTQDWATTSDYWVSEGLTIYNVNSLTGVSSFSIEPKPGYIISPEFFTEITGGVGDIYTKVTFTAGEDNNVFANIHWVDPLSITEDTQVLIEIVEALTPTTAGIFSTELSLNIQEPVNLPSDVNFYITYEDPSALSDTSWSETGSFTTTSSVYSENPTYLFTINLTVDSPSLQYFDRDNLYDVSLNLSNEDIGTYSFNREYDEDDYGGIYHIYIHCFYTRVVGDAEVDGTSISITDGNVLDYGITLPNYGAGYRVDESPASSHTIEFESTIPESAILISEFEDAGGSPISWIEDHPTLSNTNNSISFRTLLYSGPTNRTGYIKIKMPGINGGNGYEVGSLTVIQNDQAALDLVIGGLTGVSSTTAGKVISTPNAIANDHVNWAVHPGKQDYTMYLNMDSGAYLSGVNNASNISITYSSGSNWFVQKNTDLFEPILSGTDQGNYKASFYLKNNETTTARTATIAITHPVDGGVIRSVTITQDGIYNPSTDTVELSIDNDNTFSSNVIADFPTPISSEQATVTQNVRMKINNYNAESYYNLLPGGYGTPNCRVKSSGYTDITINRNENYIDNASWLGSDYDEFTNFIVLPMQQTDEGTSQFSINITADRNDSATLRKAFASFYHPRNPNKDTDGNHQALATLSQATTDYLYAWLDQAGIEDYSYSELAELNTLGSAADTGDTFTINIHDNGNGNPIIRVKDLDPSSPTFGTYVSDYVADQDYNGISISALSGATLVNGSFYSNTVVVTVAPNATPQAKSFSIGIWHPNANPNSDAVDKEIDFYQEREAYDSNLRNVTFVDSNGNYIVDDYSTLLSQQGGTETFYVRVSDYTQADYNAESSPYPITDKRPIFSLNQVDSEGNIYTAAQSAIDLGQELNALRNTNWSSSSGVGETYFIPHQFAWITSATNGAANYVSGGDGLRFEPPNSTHIYIGVSTAEMWPSGSKNGQTIILEYTVTTSTDISELSLIGTGGWTDAINLDSIDLEFNQGQTYSVAITVDGYLSTNLNKIDANKIAFFTRGAATGSPLLILDNVSIKNTSWTHSVSLSHSANNLTVPVYFNLNAKHRWSNLALPNDAMFVIKRDADQFDWFETTYTTESLTDEQAVNSVSTGDDSITVFGPTSAKFRLRANSSNVPTLRFLNPDNQNEILSRTIVVDSVSHTVNYPDQVKSFTKFNISSQYNNSTQEYDLQDNSSTEQSYNVALKEYLIENFLTFSPIQYDYTDYDYNALDLEFNVSHDTEISDVNGKKIILAAWAESPLTSVSDLTNSGSGVIVNKDNSTITEDRIKNVTASSFTWDNESNLSLNSQGYHMVKVTGLDSSKKYKVSFKLNNWKTSYISSADIDVEMSTPWIWNGYGNPDSYPVFLAGINHVNGVDTTDYTTRVNETGAIGNGAHSCVISPISDYFWIVCKNMVSFDLYDLKVEDLSSSLLQPGADISSIPPTDVYTILQMPPVTSSLSWYMNPILSNSPIISGGYSDNTLSSYDQGQVTLTPDSLTGGDITLDLGVSKSAEELPVIKAYVGGSWTASLNSSSLINSMQSLSPTDTLYKFRLIIDANMSYSSIGIPQYTSARSVNIGIFHSSSSTQPLQQFTINQLGHTPYSSH